MAMREDGMTRYLLIVAAALALTLAGAQSDDGMSHPDPPPPAHGMAHAASGGFRSFYAQNASSFVHCENVGACETMTFVDEAGETVEVPCGEPVHCTPPPFGPFGPLSRDTALNTYELDGEGGVGMVSWHPVAFGSHQRCRSAGVYAHVIMMCVAVVVLLGLGFSATMTHKRASLPEHSSLVQRHAGKLRGLGVGLAIVSALCVSIEQAYVGNEEECKHTGAGLTSHHGMLGWITLALFLLDVLSMSSCNIESRAGLSTQPATGVLGRGWAMAAAIAKLPCLLLVKCRQLQAAILTPFIGFTMDSSAMAMLSLVALTLAGLLTGVWHSSGCYEYFDFVNQEVGHMFYAIMWSLLSLVALANRQPSEHLNLTKRESKLLIFGGCLSMFVFSAGRGGGVFWSNRTMNDCKTCEDQQYMKDLQHTVQAGVWAVSGAVGMCLSSRGVATGLPVFIASVSHASMILLHGHQFNAVGILGHRLHGMCILLSGTLRLMKFIPEFAFFLVLAAVLFISSSRCMVSWAFYKNFDAISYFLCSVVATGILWGWYFFCCGGKDEGPHLPQVRKQPASSGTSREGK